jgi:hypothetical protein
MPLGKRRTADHLAVFSRALTTRFPVVPVCSSTGDHVEASQLVAGSEEFRPDCSPTTWLCWLRARSGGHQRKFLPIIRQAHRRRTITGVHRGAVVEVADTADLKSAPPQGGWGFESPPAPIVTEYGLTPSNRQG